VWFSNCWWVRVGAICRVLLKVLLDMFYCKLLGVLKGSSELTEVVIFEMLKDAGLPDLTLFLRALVSYLSC